VKHPITVTAMINAKPAQGHAPSTVTSMGMAQEKRVALQGSARTENFKEKWICSLAICPS
jgi:hypothetical protein